MLFFMRNLNYKPELLPKAPSIFNIHDGSDSWIATSKGYPYLKEKGERYWFQRHEKGDKDFQQKILETQGIKTDFNSYFSVNSFSRPQRSTVTLFRLNALYVDIDWHGKKIDYQVVLRVLEEYFFGTVVPYPTHIVFTGRGLQLFWQIHHAPKQALKFWLMIENLIVDELDSISEYLPQVNVDKSVTTVDQVVRQPNSWHVTAKTFAKELDLPYLYQYQYTLEQIADDYFYEIWEKFDKNHAKAIERQKRREQWEADKALREADKEAYLVKKEAEREQKRQKKKKITHMFNGYTLMVTRIEDLQKLLELRDHDIKGCRDTFFFFYAWTFATERTNLEKITSELKGINSLLKDPLTDLEIEAKALDVFERLPRVKQKLFTNSTDEELQALKDNSKKGKIFRGFRNETMVRRLKITREEMKYMKTIIDTREKYDRKNEKRCPKDEDGYSLKKAPIKERRAKVKELIDKGYKQKQIAEALGIDVEVVKNDRKAINQELKKTLK